MTELCEVKILMKESDLTLREAQMLVKNFLTTMGKEWSQIDNHFYLITHLMEEIGELARHVITIEFNLSLNRTEKKVLPREKALSLIEDDLGDLLYHIFKIAIAYNIDITKAFQKSMKNIQEKYSKTK